VFQGAALFARNGGAKYADPALLSMNDSQLTTELTELQVYNIQRFQHLIEQRQAVKSMTAYLKIAGELDVRPVGEGDTAAPATATDPRPRRRRDVAARMQEMIGPPSPSRGPRPGARRERGGVREAMEGAGREVSESVERESGRGEGAGQSLSHRRRHPRRRRAVPESAAGHVERSARRPRRTGAAHRRSIAYTPERYQQQNNELWQWQPYDTDRRRCASDAR
jgi:hypothetical protein